MTLHTSGLAVFLGAGVASLATGCSSSSSTGSDRSTESTSSSGSGGGSTSGSSSGGSSGLHVSGGRIVDGQGNTVVLHGANETGSQTNCAYQAGGSASAGY